MKIAEQFTLPRGRLRKASRVSDEEIGPDSRRSKMARHWLVRRAQRKVAIRGVLARPEASMPPVPQNHETIKKKEETLATVGNREKRQV